jgi:hypothetical protein
LPNENESPVTKSPVVAPGIIVSGISTPATNPTMRKNQPSMGIKAQSLKSKKTVAPIFNQETELLNEVK